MKRLFVLFAGLGLSASVASAQLALPGADPGGASAAPGAGAAAEASKPEKPKRHARKPAASLAADPASVVGHVLKLNGRNGELQLERGDDGALKVVKYSLLGEVVSAPAQRCRIDIVADKPLEATSKGEPDGLPRYGADVAVCPLSFDVVAGGALVPAQTNACVFAAADCQASPSGLWGPEAADLEKDPKAISKARAAADRSIQDSLRKLVSRDKDAAASLAREQNDFSAERDEICREYAGETRLGFCASRLAQARAALLAKRAAEAGPAPPPHKRRKKKAAAE